MNKFSVFLPFFLFTTAVWGQNFTQRTFKDTRLVNTHTIEMVKKSMLDIRIGHRFGDLKGGWDSFYGLESAPGYIDWC